MRKSIYTLFFILLIGAPLLLSGCMMWMHGTDRGGMGHGQKPGRTVVKELGDRDLILSIDIPRIVAGEEAVLVLKAERIRGGSPVTGARAGFLIERIAGPRAGVELEASETQRGTYEAAYRFEERGSYRITARLVTAEEPEAAPLTIAVTGEAGAHAGKRDSTLWMVLGGIGMAAMMIVVML